MNREGWDATLGELAAPSPLLQSWGYGETQRDEGWQVVRLDLGGACAQVQLQGPPGLRQAYVPRGPVPFGEPALRALSEWAREQGLIRLRVEPEAEAPCTGVLREMGFRPGVPLHPVHTQIVLLGPEEDMLASFKPKHRYNIRLALRKGVEVEEGHDVAELHRQHAYTARRQGITGASLGAYLRRLERLDWCRVYVAKFEGEPVAAAMVARYAGRATYLFGGSSDRHRQVMPSYAVQWTAMRDAAAAGCRDYDLFGMPASADDPTDPWHGLQQFKSGFGGRTVTYCGAWDLVLSPLAVGLADHGRRLRRALGSLVKTR